VARTIDVARAIHLLGIKRSQLQKLIKSGDLQTFEGKVDVDELKACFPATAIVNSVFEAELEFIKKAAYSNRVQDAVLPDNTDLSNQLQRARVKMVVEQQKADKYHNIVRGLLNHLSELRSEANSSDKEMIDEISQWVLQQMNQKP